MAKKIVKKSSRESSSKSISKKVKREPRETDQDIREYRLQGLLQDRVAVFMEWLYDNTDFCDWSKSVRVEVQDHLIKDLQPLIEDMRSPF